MSTSTSKNGVRLEVRGVDKRYGEREVLRQTELVIEPGQFVAIVGRSGCGKSTLLRLVAGLEAISGGAIRLDGQDVSGLNDDIRIMFQDSRLLPWKRVIDNVTLGLPREQRQAGVEVLRQVGLADRQPDWPAKLSGGQRQRVSLARALVHNPRLLLLDEPLAGMGAEESARIVELLAGLARDYAVLLVEHDMDAVFALAGVLTVMVEGAVLESGTPEQMRASKAVQQAYLGAEA
jgi:sulfonate transport system ATP-binding protein